MLSFVFFFNDTATTEIYTLSLHDALPISLTNSLLGVTVTIDNVANDGVPGEEADDIRTDVQIDRKSTRLNSSHANISYAVFCLKKKPNLQQRVTGPGDKPLNTRPDHQSAG